MNLIATPLLAVLLLSALGYAGDLAFTASSVKEIKLLKQLQAGTYEIYSCESIAADGVITFNPGVGATDNLSFCAGKNAESNIGSLLVKPQGYRLCFWQETCTCDDYACYSHNTLDDCIDTDA